MAKTSTPVNFSQVSQIFIGGAVAHSAVFTRWIAGSVVLETEKAIKFRMADRRGSAEIWFPKKAITAYAGKYDTIYNLAGWFTPDAFQWRQIERFQEIGGVSAA